MMFWFLGILVVIAYRVFDAGMNSESFYITKQGRYDSNPTTQFDGDRLFVYAIITAGFAFLWPVALPAYGIFLLGRKFRKEVK